MTHPIPSSGTRETNRLLAPVADLAIEAGTRILQIAAENLMTRSKADHSPVTRADEAAEAILVEGLSRILPGVPIIAEEAASRTEPEPPGATYFLVDPIDGTRELAAGRGEYTVNVGLVVEHEPLLGIILAPRLDTLYAAASGRAVRITLAPGERFDPSKATPIQVRPRPERLVAMVSRSHPDPASDTLLKRLPVERRVPLGSSLKFARVAEGEADVYVRLGTVNEWDVAAGHAILHAAGGSITRPDGEPLTFGTRRKGFLIDGFVAWGGAPAVG